MRSRTELMFQVVREKRMGIDVSGQEQKYTPHPESVRMFRFRPENFAFDGLEDSDRKAFRLSRRRMTAIWPNLPNARPVLAALCGRLPAWVPLLCRCLRLGVQGEEAHHVASDREPQQMDAGLELAAQG
jgi:hypothetical protein